VEAVRTYRLILDTGYHLDLMDTFYVPSITRNLISLSKLDVVGYSFKFGNGCFSLFKRAFIIGSGTLYDGLYKLNLDNLYAETLMTWHHNVGTKRSLVDERSAYLWHKHLGHISKERMQRLVKNEIFSDLDFTDLNVCVDCIKGKQTKHTMKGATRSTQLLEIIHTEICGPFDVNSFNKEKYFITFIDDFSRYGHVYLLHEKSQSVNALEVYINEVEMQLDRKVKMYGLIEVVSIIEDMMKVDNTLVRSLSSLRNVVFLLNTQCQAHHNKMVYQKCVIEPYWIWLGVC